MLYHLTLIIHLVAMALWFAVPLTQTRRLKLALAADDSAAAAAVLQIGRETKIVIASAFVTLLSGLGLAALIGFAYVQTRLWVGLGITVVMQLGGGATFGATHKKVAELVLAGQRTDALPLTKRLAIMSGVQQLLWLANVFLMTWR